MSVSFQNSETRKNLMRAFAGESQARNRYTFAACQAKKQQLHVVEALFTFTANQEKEHAEIFYNHLKQCAGENIDTESAAYPVDIADDISTLLKMAHHNELEEFSPVYPNFAQIAKDEGFNEISTSFKNIAGIEKKHGERFKVFADLMDSGNLFKEDKEISWMCLNCGYIFDGVSAPMACPVCKKPQGYFIRLSMSPWGLSCN
ncbi:MAG: rubrerythrin family protein [Clostridiales bacterium]|nr:rubrerythrin family protein [Clostridiales bacterium]